MVRFLIDQGAPVRKAAEIYTLLQRPFTMQKNDATWTWTPLELSTFVSAERSFKELLRHTQNARPIIVNASMLACWTRALPIVKIMLESRLVSAQKTSADSHQSGTASQALQNMQKRSLNSYSDMALRSRVPGAVAAVHCMPPAWSAGMSLLRFSYRLLSTEICVSRASLLSISLADRLATRTPSTRLASRSRLSSFSSV